MSVFFMNILPFNDRRDVLNYEKNLNTYINNTVNYGFSKTLITIGDKRYDPWVMAQYALQINPSFHPIIATNPTHQHPVSLVKKLSSLQNLYNTKVGLNLITGSFINELNSIGDHQSLLERNERLHEFITICHDLLKSNTTYSFSGKHYSLKNIDIYPKTLNQNSDLFISGSFAKKINFENQNLYYVKNARPLDSMDAAIVANSGLGIGLCVRSTDEEARQAVQQLYPQDRKGELLFGLALNNNETPWNVWLKAHLKTQTNEDYLYYLNPIKNYLSKAPFIVGSYATVAAQLKKYVDLNYSFFLVDFHQDDFEYVKNFINYYQSQH